MRSLNAEVLWLIERGLTAAESASSPPLKGNAGKLGLAGK